MKCVCCLIEGKEKKNFTAISSTDKKHYKEFTNLDLNNLRSPFHKICFVCKVSLKSSVKFLQTCIKSHEKLVAESETAEKIQENLGAPTRKTNEESNDNLHDQEDSFVDQIFSDDEDNIPIATLQQQIQNIPVEIVPNDEETEQIHEHIEEEQEIFSETKKTPAKFLCPECGVPFQTSQRLQIHSFTHTGIKNFKCEFDDCEKSFATSKCDLINEPIVY